MSTLGFDITARIDSLEKGLNKASSSIEKFSKENEKRFQDFGKGVSDVGKKLSVSITAPLALLAGNSVRVFADFNDQMRKVGATSGATETQLKQLTDTAKQLGQTTRFSAREAGKGLEYMALAGYDTEQSISAIPDVLNLAAAAAIDLGTAADIVTDTMSAFGIEAEKAGLVSDVFAKTQSSANTNVLQLGEAFKLSSANASSFGTDLETASAILGKFADSGIKGSQAGTTFNGILRDLKVSAEDGAVAINGQNVALSDSEGNFRDILDIMQDVENATKDLTEIQKSQALEAIFQQQSIRGVNILMQQGVGASKELRKSLYEAGGTAKEMAEQMEGGLGGAMRNLNSAFEGFSIEIGEVLAPLVQKLSGFLGKLLNYFNELSPTTKKIVVAIGGLVAVAGPLLVAFGGLMTILPAILSGLAVLTGPIGLIVLAIGALTAVVIANWDTIKKWANNIVKYFIKIYNESLVFRAGIELIILQFKNLFNVGKFVFTSLLEVVKLTFNNMKSVISAFLTVLEGVLTWDFATAKRGVKDFSESLKSNITDAVANIVDNGKELFDNLGKDAKKSIENIMAGKKEPFKFEVAEESTKNLEEKVAQSVANGVAKGLGRATVSGVSELNNTTEASTSETLPIGELFNREEITRNINGITEEMLHFNEDLENLIAGSITNTLSQLGTAIGEALATGGSVFKAMGETIIQGFGNFLGELGDMLIQYGAFAKIKGKLDLATKEGGFTAIAAGAAAIGVGIALKAISGAIGSRASSGFGGGGTGATAVGSGATSTFTSSTRGDNEVVFRIRRQELVGVLQRGNNIDNIIGG